MNRHEDDNNRDDLMVDEGELRALFAPRRPDAEHFAAGVAERLAAADSGDDDDSGAAESGANSPAAADRGTRSHFGMRTLLDRAAGVLPGLPDGGTLGKSWVTLLSLPVLLVIGILVTFAHGFRRVDPARHRDAPALTSRQRMVSLTFPAWLPTIGSLLGLVLIAAFILFGAGILADLVTLALTLAMLALTWHVGQVARVGTNAVQVGRATTMLLLAALFGSSLWLTGHVFDGDSRLGHEAVGWILILGVAAAGLLTAAQSRHFDVGLGMILLFILPLAGVMLELPTNTGARVRQHLETIRLDPHYLGNWQQASTLAHALETAGAPEVDRPRVRERLAAAIAAGKVLPPHPWTPAIRAQIQADASEVHPRVWSTAARLGLLEPAQLRRLATFGFTPNRLRNLLEQTQPLSLSSSDEHLLDCLLASRELTTAERDHLTARLDASWPRRGQQVDALEQALACARWLDRLGRRDLVEARRADLHELLRRHWVDRAVAVRFSYPGGFCTYPDSRQHATIPSTVTAVELIEFVGAPPELSLGYVNAFLRHAVHTSLIGRLVSSRDPLMQQADAGMLLLHAGIGLPERSWLQVLLGERTFLAALLLVVLGLRAIWLAHRGERALVGAMP